MTEVKFKNDGPGRKILEVDGENMGYITQETYESGKYWRVDTGGSRLNLNWMYGHNLEGLKEAIREEIEAVTV